MTLESYDEGQRTKHAPSHQSQWNPGAIKERLNRLNPGSPTAAFFPRVSVPYMLRRRFILALVLVIITLVTFPMFWSSDLRPHLVSTTAGFAGFNAPSTIQPIPAEVDVPREDPNALPPVLRPETYLQGNQTTAHFRDRLRNDTSYLTSFLSAGWTNDVITVGNLIYLAIITGRVPVLPPFTSPIEGGGLPLPFSDIFDMPRMIRSINHPILEWHQIKDAESAHQQNVKDELGCWNIWEVDSPNSGAPRGSYTAVLLNLDISFTRAPKSVKLIPDYEHDAHSTFWSLVPLVFPETRAKLVADPINHPTRPSDGGVTLLPDEQLACYDYLFYVCSVQPHDSYEKDYSPMWKDVMTHAYWHPKLVELAEGYLRRTFGLADGAEIPPFTTIHARHGDFANWCPPNVPNKEDCFASFDDYAVRIREVRDEVQTRHGIEINHVIMTGDEKDPAWWNNVTEHGWWMIDHKGERTKEKYGNWYPVILDAVIQSMGMGFIGTDRSTFSHMARRRVMDWNQGAVRMVMWGYPGADAH